DLFYRLNVISLTLPPLRERREDIPLLADFFLAKYAAENQVEPRKLTAEALRCLLDHQWPGHVRELENVIERAVVLSTSPLIGPELLPKSVTGGGTWHEWMNAAPADRPVQSLFAVVDEFERRLIVDMLEQ